MYLQVGPGEANLDLAAALEVINNLGYTSAFQRLRTQEQLGYIVYTQVERAPPGKVSPWDGKAGTEDAIHPGGPLAWSVVVQSPDRSPAELEERIEAWIAGFREELEGMSQEMLEATKASMVRWCKIKKDRGRKISQDAGAGGFFLLFVVVIIVSYGPFSRHRYFTPRG